jgi:hypothetical protein
MIEKQDLISKLDRVSKIEICFNLSNMHCMPSDIDGQGGMKLISGIRTVGILFRARKENKVLD